MFSGGTDDARRRYGEEDPYFGVYSRDDFKSQNLNEEALEKFLRSGEEHVGLVHPRLRRARASLCFALAARFAVGISACQPKTKSGMLMSEAMRADKLTSEAG